MGNYICGKIFASNFFTEADKQGYSISVNFQGYILSTLCMIYDQSDECFHPMLSIVLIILKFLYPEFVRDSRVFCS